MKIFILLLLIIIFITGISGYGISGYRVDNFTVKRYRPVEKTQIGLLHNTPPEISDLMIKLNKVAGQMVADSEYDIVADEYLDTDNIK